MGKYHTCALSEAGEVACWGWSLDGDINERVRSGDRDFERPSPDPRPVVGLPGSILQIASGEQHACALASDNTVWCWGLNEDGSSGTARPQAALRRRPWWGLVGTITSLALGRAHTCALDTQGGVQCWGKNDVGQLGDGTTTSRSQAAPALDLPQDVSALYAGVEARATCVVDRAHRLFCWGAHAFDTPTYPSPLPTPLDL